MEQAERYLLAYSLYGVPFALMCRWLAFQKNRNGYQWMWAGYLLGFFGLLLLGFAPMGEKRRG